ncbi:MAG: NERD domain-containing protein [Xanthomonadales bacterium]|nr:NERD domain-containing protein [Xanthomonadales bacterium]ODU94054.1 MAG: hypothetical protein ABT18_05155 [Rhodanobacter sp. SCN 66-43]OJY83934.1 MAG: hypothetical protein BGP23_15170 [Xanthomonadales bacterium 66-474]
MNALVPVLLVLVALAVGLLPVLFLVSWVWWQRRRDARRSPLTDELMHLPGEQAQREADRLMDVADERMLIAVLIGPMILAAWSLQKLGARSFHFGITEAVLLALVLIVGVWATWSASKVLRARRKYLEGRAAERATAQALASLVSKGCAVYHDIPADKFNLDHVVVGPGAVFMIETKSRRKPATRGKASVAVKFNGEALEFPGWRETKMLEQARAQTRWLSDLLYRKTGERVPVEPVLALPGWYVTCSVPSPNVHVINPKMCHFMADGKGKQIPEPQRRRIMTAIEECYSRG